MTSKLSIGEVIPLPQTGDGRFGDLRAVVPVRAENILAVDNVVPFLRPGANDNAHNAPAVVIAADLARVPAYAGHQRMRRIVGAALSVLAHGGLVTFLLLHEEPPLASIGLEVISVELVLGATAPAGVATAPNENETQSTSAPDTQSTDTSEAAQKATEQPQDTPVAEKETAPEVKTEPPVSELPQQVEAAVTPQEQPPEPVAVMEPQAEKPVQKKPEPKPEIRKQTPPKLVKDAAAAPERRRVAAPTRDTRAREAKASTPSSQADNVGVGRSSNDTNYRGLVAAHLARYKQYPADARSRGEGGTATVTFTIGGGGGVTAARLVRGSGLASIDAEVLAMVRRASPFPPPPGGRPQSFTVPVSFRLN
jgi:protein TonB